MRDFYLKFLAWWRGELDKCWTCRGTLISWDQVCDACNGSGLPKRIQ